MTSSLTDLSGFPIVMAVSQEAINRQMAKVHQENANRSDKFPNVPWNLSSGEEESAWSVTVESFEAPEIDFETDVFQGCRLKMTVKKGYFSIWTVNIVGGKPVPKQINTPLDGLVMYVTTPMKQISHPYLNDSQFTVQSLFVDLSGIRSVELHTSKKIEVALAGTAKVALEGLIFERFKKIGEKDPHALIFGLVSIPDIPPTTGPLAPSTMSFSTNHSNGSGNLNYLLSTVALPPPSGEAAGVFNNSLLLPNSEATFVISEATVLDTIGRALIQSDFDGAKMAIDRRVGKPVKLHLTETFNWGVSLNGRGRNAYLRAMDATVENGKIRFQYTIHTSAYGAFKDIDITVTAYRLVSVAIENEQFKLTVGPAETIEYDEDALSTFDDFDGIASFGLNQSEDIFGPLLDAINLPGNVVWKFIEAELKGDLYIKATYE